MQTEPKKTDSLTAAKCRGYDLHEARIAIDRELDKIRRYVARANEQREGDDTK